jgi:hypothetical protein
VDKWHKRHIKLLVLFLYICSMSLIIWKRIPNFESLYMVSSDGKVKSLGNGNSSNTDTKKERLLSIGVTSNGYTKVKLSKDGKKYWFSVHRLVAKTFLFNPENKPQVNHKDGNKLNNNVDNLEWVTSRENIIHSIANGLQVNAKGENSKCSKQINQYTISGEFIKRWGSINEACIELGFNSFGIIKCCKKQKKYNTAYKFKWEYV